MDCGNNTYEKKTMIFRYCGNVSSCHYKLYVSVKQNFRKSFPFEVSLREEQLLEIKLGSLLGYVECDIHVPEHLRKRIANFVPFFKDTNVFRQNNGPSNQQYAERESFLYQSRRMLISSVELKKGTIISPLFCFFFENGCRMHKELPIIWVHLCEVAQRLCTICC